VSPEGNLYFREESKVCYPSMSVPLTVSDVLGVERYDIRRSLQ
jgi:hypothetical protein